MSATIRSPMPTLPVISAAAPGNAPLPDVPSERTCPFSAFSLRRKDAPARFGALAYGLVAYVLFLGAFLYAIAFLGNWFVPKTIDSGIPSETPESLVINAGLLSIFVVQHTVMARRSFKAWWTRIVPPSIERSTYVIAASLSLAVIFACWRPLPQTIWHIEQPIAAGALVVLSLAGWLFVPLSSFAINHFDLFGLRQVWMRFTNRAAAPVHFSLRGPYRFVRHPLMLGFLVAFWSTPHMSLGHLFFAIMTTGYIFMGLWFEERDLLASHGDDYRAYARRVRGLIPIPRSSARSRGPAAPIGSPPSGGIGLRYGPRE